MPPPRGSNKCGRFVHAKAWTVNQDMVHLPRGSDNCGLFFGAALAPEPRNIVKIGTAYTQEQALCATVIVRFAIAVQK